MCQLRRHFDAAVATRRNRTLFVQCVRPLPQNERHESTAGETAATIGNSMSHVHSSHNINMSVRPTDENVRIYSNQYRDLFVRLRSNRVDLYKRLNIQFNNFPVDNLSYFCFFGTKMHPKPYPTPPLFLFSLITVTCIYVCKYIADNAP